MALSLSLAVLSSSVLVGAYLFYRKVSDMAKAGSPLFKVGYFFYTKTAIGHYYYRREVAKAQQKYNNQPHTQTEASVYNGLSILPIALSMDNYSYLVREDASGTAVLIDPADPEPILQVLESLKVTPTAILTTHRHWDHAAGNKDLRKHFKNNIPVYGGQLDAVPGATRLLADGEKVDLGGLCFTTMHTPGHTAGHVVYVLDGQPFQAPDSLFSGDHLFLAGIGRMFEGSGATMMSSLDKVCQLPDSTLVWPGHEYAKDNLRFAQHIDPSNESVQHKLETVLALRKRNKCTSPSTLGDEKSYNPFLRIHTPSILESLGLADEPDSEDRRSRALSLIRERKDKFNYKL